MIAQLFGISVLSVTLCATSLSAGSGTLVVQLVEPGWLPVPNVAVRVIEVTSCASHGRAVPTTIIRDTDKRGDANFEVSGSRKYRIEVLKEGGFAPARVCIQLFEFVPSLPTAYVQLRLRVAGPAVVVR